MAQRWVNAGLHWLLQLPPSLIWLACTCLSLAIASDLGNSFATAPHFGGPIVALAMLLAWVSMFLCALIALTQADSVRSQHQHRGYWRGLLALLPLGILVVWSLWTGLQSLRVIAVDIPRDLTSSAYYGSDEMYYAQYNAWLVLHGQNPYVGDRLAPALRHFATEQVTPLRRPPFANPLQPPTTAQLHTIVQSYLANPAKPPPQIEPATTHSYPALSFLLAVPSVWAGLPTLGYAQFAALLALMLGIIALSPARWQPYMVLLCLLDVDGIRSVASSDFAIWTTVGAAVTWWLGITANSMPRRRWWAAGALGAVCAVQQTAWFFAPFYLVWAWRERGWRALLLEGSAAAGVWLAINLPWIIASPRAWLGSLALPMTLPLFPTGGGIVGLGLSGALPLFAPLVYTLLEVVAYGALLVVYAQRWWQRLPLSGLVLPLAPLLCAWRSPSRYFILVPFLALMALVLTWRRDHQHLDEAAAVD